MFENINFGPELISGIVGVLFATIFAYIPGLRTMYAALKAEVKSLIMLGLLTVTAVVIFLLASHGIIDTLDPVGLERLLTVWFSLLITNQPAYLILPETKDVRLARGMRATKARGKLSI
ncbi:MAG: hypothetical protein V1775_02195 [Bacteroidota bacterium]